MFREERKSFSLLDEEDFDALEEKDHEFLNSQGANYYNNGDYAEARVYYEISASMGNRDAITNLGYMYMYGKDSPIDYSVAKALFILGAKKGSIDAYYKLGNMYQSGKGVIQDIPKAMNYYDKALELLEKEDKADPADYPSLFFTLGREYMPGGAKEENIGRACDYLLIAEEGYEKQIEDYHAKYYKDILEETRKLLRDDVFTSMREQEVPKPIYNLYEDEYRMKGTEITGVLVKAYYSYEHQETIYILEDKDHDLHDVLESRIEEI